MMMPRAFYREAWQGGRIQRAHLEEARAEASAMDSAETLIGALEQPEDVDRLPLLSDCLDARSDLSHAPSWREVITHQISQYCAAYFDTDQADWQPARDDGLYAGWRARMQSDHSVTLLMGESGLNAKAGKGPIRHRQRYDYLSQSGRST